MTHRSLLEAIAEYSQRGEETAVAYRRGYRMARWSYGRVARTARQFARELESRRVGRGDRVLLWGENSAEWVVAFLGCVLRGAVVVPMDRIAAPEFAQRVARQVDAKLCVVSQGVLRPGEPLKPAVQEIVLETLPQTVERHSSSDYDSPPLERADPVEIVFTSGTTAEPRGVVLSHGNLLASLEPLEAEIQKYLRYEWIVHPLRFMNLLPLSHVFGQMLGIFIPQLVGGTVVFLDTLNPAEVIRAVRSEHVSVLVAVPRLIDSLREKIERDLDATGRLARFRAEFQAAAGEHFLKRWWRFRRIHRQLGWKFWAVISGGAALPAEAEAFWTRLGYAVIQGYGLTETTSLVSVNHPFRLGRGSIGKALPGLEVRLDESGEILVRGENVAAGYWQGQKLEPVVEPDGWFHTGDLGERDAGGNFYFKGRRKNVIVTPEGMNIYPEDLEAALRGEPEVRDCVVVGLERKGNAEPCAVLLLREPAGDPEPIVQRANQKLAEYQRMRRWLVWRGQDFPRTPTLKPRLEEIRQAVAVEFGASQAPSGPERASPSASDPFSDLLERLTGQARAHLSPEARLATDLNLSSIDRVEMLAALEDRYQVDLSEAGFAEATTVGELERLLREPPGRRGEFAYPRWPQRWPVTWIRRIAFYALVWPAMRLLAWPRVQGRRLLREVRGPVLVVSNHITMLDAGYVLAALPARLRRCLAVAMEGERLQAMRHPPEEMSFLGQAISRVNYALAVALFNVFPLPQVAGFRESFAFAGELVDRGYSVLIFPEGERTRDGRMAPFRAGIGLLATRLDLPVVPVRIDGLFELKRAGKRFARPGQIQVTIGAPVRYGTGQEASDIACDLERRVTSL